MRTLIVTLLASGLIGGAGAMIGKSTWQWSAKPLVASASEVVDSDGIVRSAIDPSIEACDDFYRHACGGFLSSTATSDATPSIRMAARQFDTNLEHNLVELFAKDVPDDPELGRLKTFYGSCIRSDIPADVSVLKAWLGRINAARTPAQLQSLMLSLSAIGVDPFFNYSGQPDRRHWSRYRGEINDGAPWADKSVIVRAFIASGQTSSDAERDATSVVSMVSTLQAKAGDRYDSKTAEHPVSQAQLKRLLPAVAWAKYFEQVGASKGRAVNVTSVPYLKEVQTELENRTPAELRAYFRWFFLFSLRGELPAPYGEAFGDIPPGFRVKTDDPAGRCRDATVRAMGVEFSRQYAEHILGWKARDAARRMAEDIKKTIVASISKATWLSVSARAKTAHKLAATDLKIGFPDHWPAVGKYALDDRRFLDNVLAARAFEQRRNWSRASRPRLRTDWEMTVRPWVGDGMAAARLVVPNGFPDAFSNSLIMTAAFLAPPRFQGSAGLEIDYGTFGATFAHEFVHVAESHMFGADGQDAELWSDADVKAAKKQDSCVISQADAFEPLPGTHMPGERQFDENVADYGGVRLAFEALSARLGATVYQRDSRGTSPAQRFFYRYAQNYCTAQTDASLRRSIGSDSHGPPAFRVNGPLSNMPAFGRAFSCKPSAAMVRRSDQQCRVW